MRGGRSEFAVERVTRVEERLEANKLPRETSDWRRKRTREKQGARSRSSLFAKLRQKLFAVWIK